jgi:hypothetical protein
MPLVRIEIAPIAAATTAEPAIATAHCSQPLVTP